MSIHINILHLILYFTYYALRKLKDYTVKRLNVVHFKFHELEWAYQTLVCVYVSLLIYIGFYINLTNC